MSSYIEIRILKQKYIKNLISKKKNGFKMWATKLHFTSCVYTLSALSLTFYSVVK